MGVCVCLSDTHSEVFYGSTGISSTCVCFFTVQVATVYVLGTYGCDLRGL